ncbi:MAG: hypothetical protein AAB808_01690 [Patescibacteria group bacterium]
MKIKTLLEYRMLLIRNNADSGKEERCIGRISHQFSAELSFPALPPKGLSVGFENGEHEFKMTNIQATLASNGVCRYMAEAKLETFTTGDCDTDEEERDYALNFFRGDLAEILAFGFKPTRENAFYTKEDQRGPVIHSEQIFL